MSTQTVTSCPACGNPATANSGESGCPYCLLEIGLSATGSTIGFRATGESTGGTKRAGERFVHDGVLPQFGDYELLSEIARGGMGIVYKARQRSLDRLVAVKLILAGQLATVDSLARFRLEAQAAAQLHHPGIVPIYEIGEYETQHFFSMELIDGVSLAECLDEFRVNPKADPPERRSQELCVARLLAQVARALDFAHQHGVLHRDLKPSNILIDQEGQPHLTDFGLAKLTGREASGLTLSNAVLGTPGYLAPEQAAGHEDITTAADVYGLGATLYELLTGRPPFVGANAAETMRMAVDQTPVPPRRINSLLHRDLETIAMRCLENRPSQRYHAAAAVADDLERFTRREPIQARPVSQWEHVWRWCQRNPWLAATTGALLLAILIGSGAALSQWRRAEQANVELKDKITNLEWRDIDNMLQNGQSTRALAKVASLLRDDPSDWKAAMLAMSVMQRRRLPVPAAPPIRHPEGTELNVARVSPDGRSIVTASFDGTARIWDATTSEQILPELKHDGAVNWATFSPDGRLLATCSADKAAKVWDARTGELLGEPLLHAESVTRVEFSGDGRYLMTRTNRTVSVFDALDRKLHLGPLPHQGRVVAAKFLPDSRFLFTAQSAGKDSAVHAWDLASGEQRFRITTGQLSFADVGPDLSAVVTTSDKRCSIWDVSSETKLKEFTSYCELHNVTFSPDGESVAVFGHDHWARVWNAQTGLPVTPELPHYYLLQGLSFLGSGDRLLTWSDDALVQVWDTASGERFCEPMSHSHRVYHAELGHSSGREMILATLSHYKSRTDKTKTGAAQLWQVHDKREPASRAVGVEPWTYEGGRLSRDGKLVVLGKTTQEVWVLDTATGTPVCGPLSVNGGSWGVFFTPDASRLITTTSRGQVAMWHIPSGEPVCEPVQLKTTIQPAEIANDGKHFATGSTDGFARLWDTATGRIVYEMQHGSEINSIDFSPNGDMLASAGEDRVVRIWDAQSGSLLHELKGHQNEVMSVVFSPDNRKVVSASVDYTARVWDVIKGKSLLELPHRGEVVDAVFSPNGRYVATASRDRTSVIWDAQTGQPHSPALLHEQAVRNVRFSPDGQRLATLSFRGMRIWDAATGYPLTVHLPQRIQGGTGFQSNSGRPDFTPDGDYLLLANDSPEALLWHVAPPPPGAPPWFPAFLEAVAGQRFVGRTNVPAFVPPDAFITLRERIIASTDKDYYTRWAQQWLQDL